MFRRHAIKDCFITSRQARDEFARTNTGIKFHWLPEATDPAQWSPRKLLHDRQIDVLELGRKHDNYHNAIVEALHSANKRHLYQPDSVQLVFRTQDDLVSGYGDTKIAVCFPRSVTHPELAGGIETLTQRYFEAMASRCLIVGKCPEELSDLWGYNPIVEVDWCDPAEQLLSILENLDEYQSLVDKNHRRCLEIGTWNLRARTVMDVLGVSSAQSVGESGRV